VLTVFCWFFWVCPSLLLLWLICTQVPCAHFRAPTACSQSEHRTESSPVMVPHRFASSNTCCKTAPAANGSFQGMPLSLPRSATVLPSPVLLWTF
jgi:hypothetical protein